MSGWAKLGEALAGTSDARRADIEAKTINALASRDANVARAKIGMMKARDQAALGDYFRQIGMENPEALAGVGRSGVNLNTITGGTGKLQEQRFRQAAVDAATGGDYGGANSQLMGVANGPVALPSVQGGMLLGNRLVPGGGDVSVTPVGQAQIGADNARGQAALIRANRPPASRSSGGGSSGAPKLTERQKGQLADIKAQKKIAMGVLEATAGAANPASVASRTQAEQALAELNRLESGIYDQQEGIGERLAPPEPSTAEQPMLEGDTFYNDPATGQQVSVPAPRSARVQQVGGKPVVAVTNPSEAKAAWAKLAPGAGLKLPNGTIRWKE